MTVLFRCHICIENESGSCDSVTRDWEKNFEWLRWSFPNLVCEDPWEKNLSRHCDWVRSRLAYSCATERRQRCSRLSPCMLKHAIRTRVRNCYIVSRTARNIFSSVFFNESRNADLVHTNTEKSPDLTRLGESKNISVKRRVYHKW